MHDTHNPALGSCGPAPVQGSPERRHASDAAGDRVATDTFLEHRTHRPFQEWCGLACLPLPWRHEGACMVTLAGLGHSLKWHPLSDSRHEHIRFCLSRGRGTNLRKSLKPDAWPTKAGKGNLLHHYRRCMQPTLLCILA